jgi:hypothetical protein
MDNYKAYLTADLTDHEAKLDILSIYWIWTCIGHDYKYLELFIERWCILSYQFNRVDALSALAFEFKSIAPRVYLARNVVKALVNNSPLQDLKHKPTQETLDNFLKFAKVKKTTNKAQ